MSRVTFYGPLFENSTRLKGSVKVFEPRQNQKTGEIQIKVWNGYGADLISWKGIKIPDNILEEIEELEHWSDVSSGLLMYACQGHLS